jgi:hypothetical protein
MKKGRKKKSRPRVRFLSAALKGALVLGLAIAVLYWDRPDPVAVWREEIAEKVGARARKQWGALEAVEGTADLGPPVRITVHHSGGGVFSERTERSASLAIKAIQKTHMEGKGWDDIGYHYIIDPAGRVWEGRHLNRIGAHAGSRKLNAGNIGLLLLGNFDLQEPPPEQLARLDFLLDKLQELFGVASTEIHTHNAVRAMEGLGATACPGRHVSEWMRERRNKK